MDKIVERTPAQKANDANPAKDGPHRMVKKVVASKEEAQNQPAYVVAVVKHDGDADPLKNEAPFKYDPKELRAKARSLLASESIPLEQRRVLKEILGPEDKD